MDLEIRRRPGGPCEAVVGYQTLELRLGDGRLARFDCVQDRSCLERLFTSPRGCALNRLPVRGAVERGVELGCEVIPQRDVGGLFSRVFSVARGGRCIYKCNHRVAVLTCVARELLARQLAAFPAEIER